MVREVSTCAEYGGPLAVPCEPVLFVSGFRFQKDRCTSLPGSRSPPLPRFGPGLGRRTAPKAGPEQRHNTQLSFRSGESLEIQLKTCPGTLVPKRLQGSPEKFGCWRTAGRLRHPPGVCTVCVKTPPGVPWVPAAGRTSRRAGRPVGGGRGAAPPAASAAAVAAASAATAAAVATAAEVDGC